LVSTLERGYYGGLYERDGEEEELLWRSSGDGMAKRKSYYEGLYERDHKQKKKGMVIMGSSGEGMANIKRGLLGLPERGWQRGRVIMGSSGEGITNRKRRGRQKQKKKSVEKNLQFKIFFCRDRIFYGASS